MATKRTFAAIVHEKRNAIVRILSSCVRFDWEQPYRHAGQVDSSGSGFFFRDDGLIVTNAHVVSRAHRVWINIPSMGERRYEAQVVGICFDSDLAVLRAPTAPVTTVLALGDSNGVQIGETVIALGYPLGMKTLKLTMGVLSGRMGPLLQTDAALNPGNSGGPMLNAAGEVIGINVSIVVDSQNIGFSVPSSLFCILQDQLVSTAGRIIRQPSLGADFQRCSDATMQYLGSPAEGIYVVSVVDGFPLANAGVLPGDIVHSVNGYALDNYGSTEVPWSQSRASATDLVALLTHRDRPLVTWSRRGQAHSAQLNLEDPAHPGSPLTPRVRNMYPAYERIDFEVLFGLVFMNLTLDHIEIFSAKKDLSATVLKSLLSIASDCCKQNDTYLVVSYIMSGQTAEPVFDVGSIVDEVNGVRVADVDGLRAAIASPVVGANGRSFVTVKTRANELLAVPVVEGLLEEYQLAASYQFRMSPLHAVLQEKLTDEEKLVFQQAQPCGQFQQLQFLAADNDEEQQ